MRRINTHDLFSASRLINAMGCKEILTNIYKEVNAGKPQEEVGIMMVSAVFDAISRDENVEKCFYRFVSAPLEMSVSEVENLSPVELIDKVKELIASEDKESWMAFFRSLASMMR